METLDALIFGSDGVQVLAPMVSYAWLQRARELVDPLLLGHQGDTSGAKPGARRALLREPRLVEHLQNSALPAALEGFVGLPMRVVRAIVFDKSGGANWMVPWHQDATIALQERCDDASGFGPWSMKDGEHHCRPSRAVLDGLVSVRLHLDANDAGNGVLEVLPGSHKTGLLTAADIDHAANTVRSVACPVEAGGVLIMRPHVIHRSARSLDLSRRRRVLHLDCATVDLPEGLAWAESCLLE